MRHEEEKPSKISSRVVSHEIQRKKTMQGFKWESASEGSYKEENLLEGSNEPFVQELQGE